MRQGWPSNVLNPKAAVFFVTFLPQLLLAFGARLALARH
jgi:threonine/homoserine/homoserine lactone efflux protein